jgi:hypothetical protein
MHEWEQQRVEAPGRPWRSPVTVQGGGIEEHPDAIISVGNLRRIDRRTRRRQVRQAGRLGVPQRREVVNVHAEFKRVAGAGTDHARAMSQR